MPKSQTFSIPYLATSFCPYFFQTWKMPFYVLIFQSLSRLSKLCRNPESGTNAKTTKICQHPTPHERLNQHKPSSNAARAQNCTVLLAGWLAQRSTTQARRASGPGCTRINVPADLPSWWQKVRQSFATQPWCTDVPDWVTTHFCRAIHLLGE